MLLAGDSQTRAVVRVVAIDDGGQVLRRDERGDRLMAVSVQAVDQCITIDARDGLFTGRIDIGHYHMIGVVEALAELGEQRLEAAEPVRLHDGNDASRSRLTRGL